MFIIHVTCVTAFSKLALRSFPSIAWGQNCDCLILYIFFFYLKNYLSLRRDDVVNDESLDNNFLTAAVLASFEFLKFNCLSRLTVRFFNPNNYWKRCTV